MIGFGASGFAGTPVTKAVFLLTLVSSLLFGLSKSKQSLGSARQSPQLWHLPLTTIAFTSMMELVFGAIILYSFRHFERIFGSRKFASFVTFLWTAALLLQLLSLRFEEIRAVLLPGPYFVIFGLFVYFFTIIPSVSSVKIVGVQLSEKLLMYFLGAQLALSNLPGSFWTSLCGIALGLLHSARFLPLQTFSIPATVAAAFDRAFSPLLMTSSGDNGIYRGQRSSPNNISLQEHRTAFAPPNENDVTVLVGMGFSEDAARRALAETNNNVHLATEILLSGNR